MFEFFNTFWQWLTNGLTDMLSDFVAYLVTKSLTATFDFMLWQLNFAWSVGGNVIRNLGMADHINSALSALPSDTAGAVRFFRIPEALNLIGQAGVTRFVLRMIGW